MPHRVLLIVIAPLFIFLTGCIPTPFQVELSGQTIDITTGKPIPNVYVTISHLGHEPEREMFGPQGLQRVGGSIARIGKSMVKTDSEGRFYYKSPMRWNSLEKRRTDVSWYHPCYRSPTGQLPQDGYYLIFEDRNYSASFMRNQEWMGINEKRRKFGNKQKDLVLYLWPESKATVYNHDAEFDPGYGERQGLHMTFRHTSLKHNLGSFYESRYGYAWPDAPAELKVAWAVFWSDYRRSEELANRYLYIEKPVPIPEGEPFSPFDCSRSIEAQLPVVMNRFWEVYRRKADVLEALKTVAEKEGWKLEIDDRDGGDENTE